MKKIYYLLSFLLFVSCGSRLKSFYESNCHILGQTEYTLNIEKNGKFKLKSFLGDTISGDWISLNDTLILKSKSFVNSSSFDIENDSIISNVKYTEFDNFEKYLVKRKKIFLIKKEGVSRECYFSVKQ